MIGEQLKFEIEYEALTLDRTTVVHSQKRQFSVKIEDSSCAEASFSIPDFSQNGVTFYYPQESIQSVDFTPTIRRLDQSECNMSMSFLDAVPISKSLSLEGTELAFEINEETEETEIDTRLQICISEKNCKETKPFKLRISSMCKLNKMPTQAIGKIESQLVEYKG